VWSHDRLTLKWSKRYYKANEEKKRFKPNEMAEMLKLRRPPENGMPEDE
jgi:hypothetical protein